MTLALTVLILLMAVMLWLWLADHRELAERIKYLESESASEHAQLDVEKRYRDLFEGLLDQLNQAVLIADPTLHITYANRRVGHFFPRCTVRLGMPLLAVLRHVELTDLAKQVLEDGRPLTGQFHLSHPKESILMVDAAPMPPGFGGGVWLVLADVTERVQIERIRQDFVTNASHELRTPLTLVRGYIESMQDGLIAEPAMVQRSLGIMRKHTDRLQRLVEDMLTISRLESPEPLLDCTEFTIKDCVEGVVEQLSSLVDERQAEVVADLPEDGGLLKGDRYYWEQIFTNLIENALKENIEPGLQLRVIGEWEPGLCTITVEDNGIGIPSPDLPFIFKRFYRGQRHAARSMAKGTGLGLSIVKRGVEAHGGSIEVCSSQGIRTAFIIRLPLESPPEAEREIAPVRDVP
jgi:two-component system, OmpR family, phosphate regulon sensor histidine kinase PhoR